MWCSVPVISFVLYLLTCPQLFSDHRSTTVIILDAHILTCVKEKLLR